MSEHGLAAPLALITLMVTGSLTLALAALGTSEVPIASNHLLSAQAQAAADSGLAHAVAALSDPLSLPSSFSPSLAAAPFVPMGPAAGYKVSSVVDEGWSAFERANQRMITVTGFAAPTETSRADLAPGRAVRAVQAVVRRESLLNTLLLPAALATPLGGTFQGEADARDASAWCERGEATVPPLAGALADSGHRFANTGTVWGPGNDTPNEGGLDLLEQGSLPPSRDFVQANQALAPGELAALRELAISTGTYYRGPTSFGGSSPLPAAGSVVFVEGDVGIDPYGPDTTWTGWLVVTATAEGGGGNITVTCTANCAAPQRLTINGFVYAEDRLAVLTSSDTRSMIVNGAIVTRNRGGMPNTVTPRSVADFQVRLRCQAVAGGPPGVRDAINGTAATIGRLDPNGRAGWYLKPGSYRDVSGLP